MFAIFFKGKRFMRFWDGTFYQKEKYFYPNLATSPEKVRVYKYEQAAINGIARFKKELGKEFKPELVDLSKESMRDWDVTFKQLDFYV